MILEIRWPDSCNRDPKQIKDFLQKMVNRLAVGHYRYGDAKRSQRYMSRMQEEVKAYIKSGNQEQLINIANYCWLETVAPEHKNHNFNPNAESITRKKFGI